MKYKESTDHTERMVFFNDGTAIIIRYSRWSKKFYKAMMYMTQEQYDNWSHKGMLIQDALPHLSSDEREFLLTGYTPEDWADMFPRKDDKDE